MSTFTDLRDYLFVDVGLSILYAICMVYGVEHVATACALLDIHILDWLTGISVTKADTSMHLITSV